MKVSLKWLKAYVNITVPPAEMAHLLTMSGTEVSQLSTVGGSWDKVVVGQVTVVNPHPNADRLRLTTVNLGTEEMTVICGAPNVAAGQKVAFARVGAQLIDGHTGQIAELKPAKIRGVLSAGMVCSEKELGLSDEHTGILVLPEDAPVGVPLVEYLGDTILDIEPTPNRPDCLSILGIAHEAAALTGQELRLPATDYPELGPPIEQLTSVQIFDPDLCPRYCASLIQEVKIGPSPRWLQERLQAAGMRPISNVVDITNYVMLEYGQPLHAFDFSKLRQHRIVVRRARPGEILVTLDGAEHPLEPDMLVIADGEGPVALAGIMGGAASEVTEATTTILLESANFNHVTMRRSTRQLRMRTEASLRFDKGLNPDLALPAVQRATQLIVELAGGKATKGIIDVYPGRTEKKPLLLTLSRLKQVLGLELPLEKVESVLTSLGFQCRRENKPALQVTVPYRRTDVRLADDLAEEVARIIGYDTVPTTMIRGEPPRYQPNPARELKEKGRDLLVASGLQEIITYSLVSRALLDKVSPGVPALRLANPMSAEQEYLRPTLRGNLLATLAANERHQAGGLLFFEIGKIYLPREKDLPEEKEVVCSVLGGPPTEPSWRAERQPIGFFEAKGILETILRSLGLMIQFDPAEDPLLLPGRAARVVAGQEEIGVLGEINPQVLERFDIGTRPVLLFELYLDKILLSTKQERRYQPIRRFPGILRDLAVVADQKVPSARIAEIIASSPLVAQVTLFDVYTGEQVPPGQRSLAYRVVYQSPERTLTDEEVEKAQQGILRRLSQELGAALRQ